MDEQKAYWAALSGIEGIGPLRFHQLIRAFGSAKKALQAPASKLSGFGLPQRLVTLINKNLAIDPFKRLEKIESYGYEIIASFEPKYPQLLKEIPDAPPVIYVKRKVSKVSEVSKADELHRVRGEIAEAEKAEGSLDIFQKPAIAVVGTRKMTAYGRRVTEELVTGLVEAGLVIVSGLALGVDAIAHKTAIDAGGQTIAVLAGGAGAVYPRTNYPLSQKIFQQNGAFLWEHPPGYLLARTSFPSRNRLISGLSLGVLVIEGEERSGSMITPRHAAEQGREVFAVPGPITSRVSAGPAMLIKMGAKLVTNLEDILEELKIKRAHEPHWVHGEISKPEFKSKAEERIWQILDIEKEIDEIVRQSKIEISRVSQTLTTMELRGMVRNLKGKWSRI